MPRARRAHVLLDSERALILQHGDWGPPGVLAESDAGVQAFRFGRHLGVQLHPESTIAIVQVWAREERERLAAFGIDDGEALLERGRHHAAAARDAALRLFDAFWQGART